MKAIVIDDSRAMRAILRRALSQHGFEVIEAPDGQAALDNLERLAAPDRPHLALVDWNMPVMTGYDFIRIARSRRHLDAMAIMMVTTETEPAQVAKALDAGANEYMMKPFSDEILQEKLLMLGMTNA